MVRPSKGIAETDCRPLLRLKLARGQYISLYCSARLSRLARALEGMVERSPISHITLAAV